MEQNKLYIWALVRSLSLVLGVATVCGAVIGYITHNWSAGAAGFIAIAVLQYAINSIVLTHSDRKNKEAEYLAQQVLREAAERRLPFDLNCAYCNTLNRTGISFNAENIFDCSSCHQPNKVFIQFTTVRITTPINRKEDTNYIDIDGDAGVGQSTINQPIRMNEG